MGEKGNLLDMGEEIFANLAEQGPQFWLDYEQYKLTRVKTAQAHLVVAQQADTNIERQASTNHPSAERPTNPATG